MTSTNIETPEEKKSSEEMNVTRENKEEVVEEEEEEELDAREIQEEYKVWKKNTPFLYDLVVTHALEWPSLTVEWLQKKTSFGDKDISEHELVLGTHTSPGEQNYLMIARVRLPNEDAQIDARQYDDEKGELGSYGGMNSKFEIKVRINHDGEVNRARYMPQDDYVIATKTISGQVHVFFIREHESTPSKDGISSPNIRCVGHSKEGYGLDWSKCEKGHLISSADDSYICHWDTQGSIVDSEGLQPLNKIQAHDGIIGDVAYHFSQNHIFGSVGDDTYLNIWDLRDVKHPKYSVKAHSAEVQTLSFSPFNEFLLATGSADKVVSLWDMRKIEKPIHNLQGHQSDVLRVNWSPFNEAILGSCGSDRRVLIWDLSRIGLEQSADDAADGPAELLFIHGGHTNKVSDFSWNPNDPWVMASVAEDNIVQIWQMADNLYAEEDKEPEIDDEDLE